MNWDALGAIAEIFGAIAVLATLVYLARQIRLSNSIAIASSEIDIRGMFGLLNEGIFGDTEFATVVAKAGTASSELDDIEQVKMMAWLRQILNIWISMERAHKAGMLPDATYDNIFDDARYVIDDLPGVRPILQSLIDYYPALSETKLFLYICERLAIYQT
jgi:hypothetical protein